MVDRLTPFAIRDIFYGNEVENPIVQINNIRKVQSNQAPDRFRAVLSDGSFFMQSVLATQLNTMVSENELVNNYIVRLRKYICNNLQPNRKIIIILELDVLDSQVTQKLGNPSNIEQQAGALNGQDAPAPAPAPAPVVPPVAGHNGVAHDHTANGHPQSPYKQPQHAPNQQQQYEQVPQQHHPQQPLQQQQHYPQAQRPPQQQQQPPQQPYQPPPQHTPYQPPQQHQPHQQPPLHPYQPPPQQQQTSYQQPPFQPQQSPYQQQPQINPYQTPPQQQQQPYHPPQQQPYQPAQPYQPPQPYQSPQQPQQPYQQQPSYQQQQHFNTESGFGSHGQGSSSRSTSATTASSHPPVLNEYGSTPASNFAARVVDLDGEKLNIFPIKSLNPYQNRWTIKARVTQKSDIRVFANPRGEGKLFSMDLIDETGEIRATGFGETVTRFYDMIQPGQVYYLSKGSLKAAKKPFNTLKHDFEITLENTTMIRICREDVPDIPAVRFSFVPINQMESVEKDNHVDVIGILTQVGESAPIVVKATQKTIPRRNIVLVDRSQFAVQVTLWNQFAETFSAPVQEHPVIAVKAARVTDFGGRSLSTGSSSVIHINPDLPETHQLRMWFDNEGSQCEFKSISDAKQIRGNDVYKTLLEVRNENLGSTQQEFFANRGYITMFRTENTIAYQACPSEGCNNKKITEEGTGQYTCENCHKTFPRCNYRYVLSVTVMDHTGTAYMSIFNDVGEAVLKHSANDVVPWRNSDPALFQQIIGDAQFRQYNMSIKAKTETYQNEDRVKLQVMRATPVNFVTDAYQLVQEIHRYSL